MESTVLELDTKRKNMSWYENITDFRGPGAKVPLLACTFDFEYNFDVHREYELLVSFSLWHIGILMAAYVALVFGGPRLMRHRRPFDLRGMLVAYNLILSATSFLGAVRTLSELWYLLSEFGFQHSVCKIAFYEHHKVLGFWSKFFVWSKLWETLDTVFIVLRKQNLIFLHWYHHITVVLYVYHSFLYLSTSGRWFMSINMAVHSFMYFYYAMKALRFRVPKQISMLITLGQISQMVVGIYINYRAYQFLSSGTKCQVRYENIMASFVMYASYLILFGSYFANVYFLQKRKIDQLSMKKTE